MPYKYIGRTTDFKGKTLWEIVGNLKNFGVGRIVARSLFERYSEPSYLKILKVEPLPCPETQNVDNLRKVRVLVEKTFRGKKFPQPITIESASYKTDYKLIPKDEEEAYCKTNLEVEKNEPLRIYPKQMDFPPVLRELVIREMRAAGKEPKETPKLDIEYQKKNSQNYKLETDVEKPNVDFGNQIKDTKFYKELYSNVESYKKISAPST